MTSALPLEAAEADVYRTCTCGRPFSAAQWRALPTIGVMHVPGGPCLVHRNCPSCDTTMSEEIDCDCEVAHERRRCPRCGSELELDCVTMDPEDCLTCAMRDLGLDIPPTAQADARSDLQNHFHKDGR